MAFNAIKITKLYYFAKTLDSLSYRKIRLKLRKGFWVVWYMKRGRWWWWMGGGGRVEFGGGGCVLIFQVGLEGNMRCFAASNWL